MHAHNTNLLRKLNLSRSAHLIHFSWLRSQSAAFLLCQTLSELQLPESLSNSPTRTHFLNASTPHTVHISPCYFLIRGESKETRGIWKSYELIRVRMPCPLRSLPHSCGWVMVVMAWVEKESLLPAGSCCGLGDGYSAPWQFSTGLWPLDLSSFTLSAQINSDTLSGAIILLLRGYW